MRPTLDLGSTTHSKMMVVPPRLNLRRAASYNHQDKGPLSATSSRFNFNHLLFSPPPSPSLPALIPRPKKSPIHPLPRPSRVFRLLCTVTGLGLLIYLAAWALRSHGALPLFRWGRSEFNMARQADVPDFPTPIVVADSWGKNRWTVSIPPAYHFPLSIKEYSDLSSKCQMVAERVRHLDSHGHASSRTSSGHSSVDPNFVDVQEAEASGMLRGVATAWWHAGGHDEDGALVGESKDSLVEKPVCLKSMTFVLESDDAGLGATLMLLWSLYGLAKKQGRSFFIDDTRWAYGHYTDLFGPPPAPDCRAPPRHEILPCPSQASHIAVSAATVRGIFGYELGLQEADTKSKAELQTRELFNLARDGYLALFHLVKEDKEYVDGRIRDLVKLAKARDSEDDGTIVGMHVRRGDLHPLEYQYRDSYIPMETFVEKAHEIADASSGSRGDVKGETVLVLASDDPTAYEADEFTGTVRAQEQIRLASKAAIQRVNPDRNVIHKFIDETFGWEGGFFAAMFWNLGVSTLNAANAGAASLTEKTRLPPSTETLRLRSFIGRAYLMDLAVLVGASDAVVCTVSATGCRLLAIMMGWEAAFESANWVNVDGTYGWTGIAW